MGRPDLPDNEETPLTVSRYALRYVAGRSRSHTLRPSSATSYRRILLSFAHQIGDPQPRRVTSRVIARWIEHQDVSPATLRSRIFAVRGLFDWLVFEHVIRSNPVLGIGMPRVPDYRPRGLPADAVGRLFGVLPDARATFIVLLMVQEGLRCGEVCRLQYGWVSFDEQLVLVRGKGDKERVLPLSDETWRAMTTYLADHPTTAGPLIRSYRFGQEREALRSQGVSQLVTGWMYDAGIKGQPRDLVSPHALRHTAAHDMLRNGAHVRDVQAALGHANLATTQRYLPWVVGDLRTAMGGRAYRHVQPLPTQ